MKKRLQGNCLFLGKGSRQPSEMLKSVKRWLTAVGLSAALLLSSPIGFSKTYAAKQQQTQQTQQQQQNQSDREVRILYKYLDLNKKIQKYRDEEIYAIAISHKRNSLEEKVEKVLGKQAASIFSEMYPTEGRRDFIIDLTNTPTILLVVKRSGEEVYKKIYDKSLSENALEKLEDLAEFLGPDAVEKLEEEFKEMSERGVVKRIDKMIKQAKKENNGKLERKYRAFAKSLEGSIRKGSNKACVNRYVDLNRIMRAAGHEYGHILYTGYPLQSRDQGEQFILIETACDLLGDEFSLRYAQKYLKGHPEKYKEYMDSISKMERQSSIGRDLIVEADKLLMAGKFDLAEKLMDETAKKMGVNEINQANIAVVKSYSGINYVYDELSSILKELGPDYFAKVIKYTTNFSESSCAYRLMEKINEMRVNELEQNYIENQEAIRGLTRNSFPRFIPMDKWEMRKEFIKESILEHELYERLPEKEAAEIIKGK